MPLRQFSLPSLEAIQGDDLCNSWDGRHRRRDRRFTTSIEMSWRMGIARSEGVVELIRASYYLGSILERMSLPL